MDEKVRKELDTIEVMIQRWKIFWLGEYRDPADYPDMEGNPNEWILDEFSQLIFGGDYYHLGIVSSYINRMRRANLLTAEEFESFVERIYGEIKDMRRLLGLQDEGEDSP